MNQEDRRKAIESMTPEERVQLKSGLLATMEGRGLKEEPGMIDKMQAGYASLPSPSRVMHTALMDWKSEFMADKLIASAAENLENNPPDPNDPIAMMAAMEGMDMAQEYAKNIKSSEMNKLKQEKTLLGIAEYGDIWGTTYAESAPHMIAAFSNYVIDPTTLIPIPGAGASMNVVKGGAQIAKGAAVTAKGIGTATASSMTGGMLVGMDNAAWQLFDKGEIDYDELQMWTAGGAAFIPLITLGGKKMTSWLSSRRRTGEKTTPQEVKDALNKFIDPKELGDKYGQTQEAMLFLQNLSKNKDQIAVNLSKKINENIIPHAYDNMGQYLDEVFDMATDASITVGAKGQIKITHPKLTEANKARRNQVKQSKHEPRPFDRKTVAETPASVLSRVADQRLYARELAKAILATEEHGIFNAKNGIIAKKLLDESDKAWKMRRDQLGELERITEQAYKLAEEEADRIMKAVGPAHKKAAAEMRRIEAVVKAGRRELTAAENMTVARSRDLDAYTMHLEEVIDDVRIQVQNLIEETGIDPKIIQDGLSATINTPPSSDLISAVMKSQAGYANQQMVQGAGMAVGGAMAGGAIGDGPESAFLGALAGLTMGVTLLKAGKGEGLGTGIRNIVSDKTALKSSLNRLVNRPLTMLKAMGPQGKVIAEKFKVADLNMNRWVGQATYKFSQVYQHVANNKLDEHFVKVMQGVEKAQDAGVQKAVDGTRAMMASILDRAVRVGVITPEAAKAMKARKDYWPRVYNQLYLLSKQGEDNWMKKFTEKGTDRETIESMSEAILGKRFSEVEKNKHMIKNMEDGTYSLSREWAKKLYNKRAQDTISQRSTHLENTRKIHLKEQDFLNEFLLQDPQKAMMMYIHDTNKRIAFAKEFGAKDELAVAFMKDLDKNGQRMEMEYMRDLYYGAVGSENSSIIQAQTKLSSMERNILGSVNAFETLKLSAAQVLQVTQATVNGMTYMSKHGGGNALKNYYKGLKESFSKEGREFAMKTGASVETTFMQLVAEASTHSTISSAFGKHHFDGPAGAILNKLNNPSEFLSAIGFIYLEKGQRVLAANMGKNWIEDLVKRRTVLQQIPEKTRTKAQLKEIKKINKTFSELSMPPSMTEKQLRESPEILERAAQAFSNTINHTNSIEKLPLGWRGPYARTFLKFKSFAYHQSAFLNDHVINPAIRGELRPLMAYLGVGATGMAPDEFRRFLKSDDKKLTNTSRYLRALTAIGGAGIVWDGAINFATNKNAGQTWSFVGGPAVGDMHKIVGSYHDAFKKRDPRAFLGDMFSTVSGSYPGKKPLVDLIKGN